MRAPPTFDSKPLAVLGGAFDPVTCGHLKIASLVEALGFKVLFMPCGNKHSFGKKMVSSRERVHMLELVAPNRVTDAEIRANSPYAEDTYRILTETYGDVAWIIGSDNANNLHKWRNGETLKKTIRFLVIGRPGYPISETGRWCLAEPHRFIDLNEDVDISSTDVRAAAARGDWATVGGLVPGSILNRIKEMDWYQPALPKRETPVSV